MPTNNDSKTEEISPQDVAIIGISCRFPGAQDKNAYWENLINSRESITFLTNEQIKADRHLISNPYYVPACGLIEEFDHFDAELFNIPESTAELMTPEHRAFLECAWDVMIDAGYDASTYVGEVAVYGACNPQSIASYGKPPNWVVASDAVLEHSQAWCPDALTAYALYHLGLTGEAMTLNALCSGFHSAVHFACQSLLLGQVEMAVAGGVMIRLPHERGYLWEEGKPLSRDGHSRPFDAKATGAPVASGVATFLLKPLSNAMADRDHIYAVIKGTAINNNGASSMGFGIFQPDRLAACIATSIAVSNISTDAITMVEAVGAGLLISDAVEAKATARAFNTNRKGYCSMGSAKANIGHAGVASGGASAIKAALSIYYGILPESINFETPNPEIDFASLPFYMQRETSNWNPSYGLRCASVNAIGGAGYNANMIMQQAPAISCRKAYEETTQLILISAHNESSLKNQLIKLQEWLLKNQTVRLDDLAYTLHVGRKGLKYRWVAIVNSLHQLCENLSNDYSNDNNILFGIVDNERPSLNDNSLTYSDLGVVLKDPSMRTSRKGLLALGKAWASGYRISSKHLYQGHELYRISLPAYSFTRRRFWRTYWD
jgi:3-oxoacyl-[acyl-carrier-protein] synthase II